MAKLNGHAVMLRSIYSLAEQGQRSTFTHAGLCRLSVYTAFVARQTGRHYKWQETVLSRHPMYERLSLLVRPYHH